MMPAPLVRALVERWLSSWRTGCVCPLAGSLGICDNWGRFAGGGKALEEEAELIMGFEVPVDAEFSLG